MTHKRRRPTSARPVRTVRVLMPFVILTFVVLGAAIAAIAGATGSTSQSGSVPAAKQALLDQEQQRLMQARQSNVTKPTNAAAQAQARAVTTPTLPPRVSELFTEPFQGPFRPTEFQDTSFWQGAVGGVWLQVWAGADVSKSPTIGALRVYSMPIDPNNGPDVMNFVGSFAAPARAASLAISAAAGGVLVLTTPSGHGYAFNLVTHSFTAR